MEENDVTRIEADNSKCVREQCFQMFQRWKAVDPENYTYPVLGDALLKEDAGIHKEFVEEVQREENALLTK